MWSVLHQEYIRDRVVKRKTNMFAIFDWRIEERDFSSFGEFVAHILPTKF